MAEIWLQSLVRRLAERRVAGWTYVPRFARGFDARTVEEWTRDRPWRFRVVDDRTPMVVEFGGVRELRLVTYQGFPAAVPVRRGERRRPQALLRGADVADLSGAAGGQKGRGAAFFQVEAEGSGAPVAGLSGRGVRWRQGWPR